MNSPLRKFSAHWACEFTAHSRRAKSRLHNYTSIQTGQTKEIPAYCVDPRLYGVPALVEEGTAIKYSAESIVNDPTPQQIELKAGDGIRDLVFFNDLKPGMRLVKVDSANPSSRERQPVGGDQRPEVRSGHPQDRL